MSKENEFYVDNEVEVHGLIDSPEYNGMRGTIMEPLQYVRERNRATGEVTEGHRYLVHLEDGLTTYLSPDNLRKPPEEFDQLTAQEFAQLMQRLTRPFAFEKAGKA